MSRPPATVTVVCDARGVARALRMPAYRLRVTRGPAKGLERLTHETRLVIGRSEGADWQLEDATLSALHCELLLDFDGLRIRDLGARNGVRLGGRRVVEAWLEPKDAVTLGETVLELRLVEGGAEQALPERTSFGRLRGSSLRMRQLYGELERCAGSAATLLLRGETGTGKDLAARAVAETGVRAGKPFVIVDCGCLPAALAENELFGHEPGAFSGADQAYVGAFERAQGGTLFLDEVGELSASVQAKLLGVLERRALTRLGGTAQVALDVRVIAATHRALEREVNRGGFRADLFYRLSVLTVSLPALREHREDVPELIAGFLAELDGSLPASLLEQLYQAEYPGNVRELRAAVERSLVGLPSGMARSEELPDVDLAEPYAEQKARLLAGFERAYLRALMAQVKGNVSEASRRSGLNRQHLHTLLRKQAEE